MAYTSSLNLMPDRLQSEIRTFQEGMSSALRDAINEVSLQQVPWLSGYRIEPIDQIQPIPLRTNFEPIEVLPRSVLEFRPEYYIQMNGWQAALSVDTELERDRIRASLIDQVKKIEDEIKLACSDQYFVV